MKKDIIKALEKEVRIKITDSQYHEVEEELQKMEEIAFAFSKIDTTDVEPMVRCFDTDPIFRKEDQIQILTQEEALENAKYVEDGYIEMARVVK